MSKFLLLCLCAGGVLVTGCNLIYKQNVQQGNALEQEDLDQLELGMTRNQVLFLLGTPAINDPFHHDRWDYISTFSRRGGKPVRRLVTLEFESDRLSAMYGVGTDGEAPLATEVPAALTAAPVASAPGPASFDAGQSAAPVPRDVEYWSLQVGTFRDRAEAESAAESLRARGTEARVYGQQLGDVGYFLVRTGEYASRDEALRALSELEAQTGLRPFLVSPGV